MNEIEVQAINIIRQAFPEKPKSWAQDAWTCCVNNIDVPVTAEVALELLELEFGIVNEVN